MSDSATSWTVALQASPSKPQFSHLRNLMVRITKLPLRVLFCKSVCYHQVVYNVPQVHDNQEKTIFHLIFFFLFLLKKNCLFYLAALGHSCAMWDLWMRHSDSPVMLRLSCCVLSCSTEGGTLAPRPGIEPGPPALQSELLSTGP